jgi:hypothetical protein
MFVLPLVASAMLNLVPARQVLSRASVASAIAASGVADGCSRADTAMAVDSSDARRIGTLAGDPLVLIAVQAPCLCGNVNCPYLVARIHAGTATSLLVMDAYQVDVVPVGEPLPRLREESHDSALLHTQTIHPFRNGAYVTISTLRVRADTGESRPESIPIHFDPGASSIELRGTVDADWGDNDTFVAAAGQVLSVNGISPRGIWVYLTPADRTPSSIELASGTPIVLHAGGIYGLAIGTHSDGRTPYQIKLRIR